MTQHTPRPKLANAQIDRSAQIDELNISTNRSKRICVDIVKAFGGFVLLLILLVYSFFPPQSLEDLNMSLLLKLSPMLLIGALIFIPSLFVNISAWRKGMAQLEQLQRDISSGTIEE